MMSKKRCFSSRLVALTLWAAAISTILTTEAFTIPLPGGRSISLDEGTGVLRIQLEDASTLPTVPPSGTLAQPSTLDSIQVRDTGTSKNFGAFCITQPLVKETFLGFYEGTLITIKKSSSSSSSEDNIAELVETNTDYVMSLDGGITFMDGYERAQNREIFSPVHLNHADKTSAGCNCLRVLSSQGQGQGQQVAFFTARDVNIGEELCFDYGENYWKGRENQKI